MFIEMEEYRDDKNWAYFYKIKWFANDSYQIMSTLEVVLLIQYHYVPAGQT